MFDKIFSKKPLAAGVISSVLMMGTVAHAATIEFSKINMDVRSSTYQVEGTDTVASLLTEFSNSGDLSCNVNLSEFTGIVSDDFCSGIGRRNLATLYTIDYMISGVGDIQFEFGTDWGRGGILIGTNAPETPITDNIWWAMNWNNSDVLDFSLSGAGAGSFRLLGFENGNTGPSSLRFSSDGGQTFAAVTQTVSEPAVGGLFLLGLAGLMMVRRRQI